MGLVIRTISVIDKGFKTIRLCDFYEEILARIMNDSKVVFPSTYTHIKPSEQNGGKPDFYDNADKEIVFDAKLLFSEELCQDLSKEAFQEFVKKLHENLSFDVVEQRCKDPNDMPIFIDMKRKIEKLTGKERGILFLPFPVSCKQSNSITSFLSDVFDYCFSHIETDHEVYLICLNDLNEVVLSKLGNGNLIEFLPNTYFNELVCVDSLEYKKE